MTTLTGHTAVPEDLTGLAARLRGTLALPGEAGHETLSRPWNVAVRPRPAAVVEAADAEDVVEAVRFAGAAGMAAAVQATGHGIAADLDGALLVHTGRLDECTVHPEGWARVGAGVRWQQVLDAAAPHRLGALAGSAPRVGVVGYTTGGGLGPVARTFGLASDLVRAVEVVTGDGVLRRATATEEPDLFWGIRGGKGALGIVTALEFDLLRQPEVYGGSLFFSGDDAATVLHTWASWCVSLPEQATTSVALVRLPDLPQVPAPLAGRATVSVRFVWTGSAGTGEALLAPMRSAATPLVDTVTVLPFAAIGAVHNDPVDPMPVHEGGDLLHTLNAEAVEALLAVAGPHAESPQVVVEVRQLGGAVAREPRVPSAVCHRDAAFSLLTIGVPVPPVADAVVGHSAAVLEAMAPWALGATPPNFAPSTGAERLARSYDEPTLARLTGLMERYDPDRVFRVGQVPPR